MSIILGIFEIITAVFMLAGVLLAIYMPVYLIRSWDSKYFLGCMFASLLYLAGFICGVGVVASYGKTAVKSKSHEARQNLGAIFTCQVAYFGEQNQYAGGPDAFELLSWRPEGESRYAYYCGDDVVPNTKGDEIKLGPGKDWPLDVRSVTSDFAFTCLAIANIDNDEYLDVWMINDNKEITRPVNDVFNSAAGEAGYDAPAPSLSFGENLEAVLLENDRLDVYITFGWSETEGVILYFAFRLGLIAVVSILIRKLYLDAKRKKNEATQS